MFALYSFNAVAVVCGGCKMGPLYEGGLAFQQENAFESRECFRRIFYFCTLMDYGEIIKCGIVADLSAVR